MDAKEFRRFGYQLIDWVADYREGLARLPVMSQVQPGEIRAAFPAHPPQQGGRLDEALAALDRDVMPGITHWNHASFFAYFPSNTSYASILADIVASGLGVQGMSWQTSPAATPPSWSTPRTRATAASRRPPCWRASAGRTCGSSPPMRATRFAWISWRRPSPRM